MELNSSSNARSTRKRRRLEEDDQSGSTMSLDELNRDLLERVLARLPPSSFFRCRSVCKRWSSVATSATFRLACSQLPFRDPWFYMVGPDPHHPIVFDTSGWSWRSLDHLGFLGQFEEDSKPIPVASSGGLICFRTASGALVVSNPVNGAHRELPAIGASIQNQQIHAIAMDGINKEKHSYRLVVVWGEFPSLSAKIYDSQAGRWEEEIRVKEPSNSEGSDASGDNTVYFLSKAGEVVATDMQRSPSKQYSSVITVEGGEEVIHFLSPSGAVVACGLARRTLVEYPRLLPAYLEYSIDVVECGGEMLAVVLSDLLESASMRVWKLGRGDRLWHQVASMPPSMSHEFYGKKADVNCVGCRDAVVVCVSSSEFNGCFACDLATNRWLELPRCWMNGETKEFMSAFSFEPRIEACV